MDRINEYYAIRTLNGIPYKLFNVIRIMTIQGKVDACGYVSLSYAKIKYKIGIENNIVRLIDELQQHPEIVEVVRGDTNTPNKFRINNPKLLI